jgi:hypothetical protein
MSTEQERPHQRRISRRAFGAYLVGLGGGGVLAGGVIEQVIIEAQAELEARMMMPNAPVRDQIRNARGLREESEARLLTSIAEFRKTGNVEQVATTAQSIAESQEVFNANLVLDANARKRNLVDSIKDKYRIDIATDAKLAGITLGVSGTIGGAVLEISEFRATPIQSSNNLSNEAAPSS